MKRLAGPTGLFILVTAIASELAAAGPPSFAGVNLNPLLRVHGSRQTNFDDPTLPPAGGRLDEDLFVSIGGATVSVSTGIAGSLAKTRLLRGIGSAQALSILRTALTQAKVGFLRDCAGLVEPGETVAGTYEITWYGKNGRRNAFTVHYSPPEGTVLPVCGAEVSTVLNAIVEYEFKVSVDPKSEVLQSN